MKLFGVQIIYYPGPRAVVFPFRIGMIAGGLMIGSMVLKMTWVMYGLLVVILVCMFIAMKNWERLVHKDPESLCPRLTIRTGNWPR